MNTETEQVVHYPEEKLTQIREEASKAYNEDRLSPYWFSVIIDMAKHIDRIQAEYVDYMVDVHSYNYDLADPHQD